MSHISPVLEAHVFEARDFVGGHPVLDFINTVTGRDQTPRDWLPDYDAWLAWLARSSVCSAPDVEQLAARAAEAPGTAERALRDAKRLREALFGIVGARSHGAPVAAADLETLERAWKRAMNGRRLIATAGRIGFDDPADPTDVHLPVHRLALDAVKLLEASPDGRLRMCAGSNCAWLFIDRSKTGRRKWCDMATCGNVAKARRHYRAVRRAPDGSASHDTPD
ncbi:TPA: CGNR zinc finger domain-containing protein [Burkholderia aenigmatica]|uniref:CGNR zinc finger domain-containing protein n=1 Tax=Burkholderia sp. AU45251 TaxID=3059204 RepID=UPI00264B49A2|nr:ABATE domain-containing protein [Burkholderia sp. AU45251]HDR9487634.1 CGNR zinc finger domain-containing protein [Burkholderia aenigmatica]MDN7520475.1 CGNR zinc finger domain-containing protein [Burkholderia sp. AU45251]HDR9519412.1 CGNR zinc finger domain-containing protein [Burkholderia aenigmatica]HDR9596442.1 CGNR zinc finger domain-containing protein [Burkholderia aenigmatica]HDR9603762.1 CGNR zinc finger domain-containing protein [Burkholderia aenigmatica]